MSENTAGSETLVGEKSASSTALVDKFFDRKQVRMRKAGFVGCVCENSRPCVHAGDLIPAKGIAPAKLFCRHFNKNVLVEDVGNCDRKPR